jgi:hypothetical protein
VEYYYQVQNVIQFSVLKGLSTNVDEKTGDIESIFEQNVSYLWALREPIT